MKLVLLLLATSVASFSLLDPVVDCTDTSKDLADALFAAAEEIERNLANPDVKYFLNIRVAAQRMINTCWHKDYHFDKYDQCIIKVHPVWNLIDQLAIAIGKGDTNAILRLSTEIVLELMDAATFCSKL